MSATTTRAGGWLVSAPFDLAFVFGGALVSVAALGAWAAGVPIALLFWAWLLLVDGPHIGATFTRTYVDRAEWRARPRFLWATLLLAFAAGPACLLLNVLTGSEAPFQLFLGVNVLWAFHHVTRQHWGFVALYRARAGERDGRRVDAAIVYAACWAPYLFFVSTHPWTRRLLELPPELGPLDRAFAGACLLAFLAAAAALVVRARAPGASRPKLAYLATTLAHHALVYLLVGRLEPVYAQPRTADEALMLVSVMGAMVHGWQYVPLVWLHNRARYGDASVDWGPARALNATAGRYLAGLAAFSAVVYLGAATLAGVFPVLHPFWEARLGPVTVSQVGLCLWWGLGIHHYVVDAKIWRVSAEPRLARDLGLA